jgi:hypothetical protein
VADDVFAAPDFDEADEPSGEFRETDAGLRPESSVGILFWLAPMVIAAAVVTVVLLGLPIYYLASRDVAPRPAAGPVARATAIGVSRAVVAAPAPLPPADTNSAHSNKNEAVAKLPPPAAPKKPALPVGASQIPAPAVAALHSAVPAPAASIPKATPIRRDEPPLSAAQIAALSAHGDDLLGAGDIASARLFYERAADAGDGRAALRLGATFDPNFLAGAGLHDVRGDAAQALAWYRRARELGAADAERWIKRLEKRAGR